jgi:hypothetical protein
MLSWLGLEKAKKKRKGYTPRVPKKEKNREEEVLINVN